MGVMVKNDHYYTLSFANVQAVVKQDEGDLSFILRKLEDEYQYRKTGVEINQNKMVLLATTQEAVMDLKSDLED